VEISNGKLFSLDSDMMAALTKKTQYSKNESVSQSDQNKKKPKCFPRAKSLFEAT